MTAAGRSGSFRPDIEGLRGIAVLLVVLFHSRVPGFSGGFLGVDVFFVLSGYLITGLLVAEIEAHSKLKLVEFYARRARRLLPASVVVLIVTLVAGTIVLAPQELMFAGRAARASAVYLSNVFFTLNSADYFAPNVVTNPFLHTWSLAVEEQFYLVWPLLIMLGLQVRKSKLELAGLLAAVTVASFAASVWLTRTQPTFAFYNLPTRAWEFGLGGLAALIPRGALTLPMGGWACVSWIGLATVVASGYVISEDMAIPGWLAMAPVLGTVAVIVAAAERPFEHAAAWLAIAPLQWIGKLSYSWYLWHWPVLIGAAALVPGISGLGRAVAVAFALLLAAITHYMIENPIRFHPVLLRKPRLSVALGAAISLAGLVTAIAAVQSARMTAATPGMRPFSRAAADIADMPRDRCVSLAASAEVRRCDFGDLSAGTTVVLFGDSHAIQWFNPLQRIADAHGWRLATIVKSGCPATDVRTGDPRPVARACEEWRAAALQQIIALRPSLVFIGNANGSVGRDDTWGAGPGISADSWRSATRRTLEALTGAGLRVVSVRDTPTASFDVPTCLARHTRLAWLLPSGACDIERSAALNTEAFEAEQTAARGLANVHFLDLTDHLCAGETCAALEDGVVRYRDDNHITGSFAALLTPVLEEALVPLVHASHGATQ